MGHKPGCSSLLSSMLLPGQAPQQPSGCEGGGGFKEITLGKELTFTHPEFSVHLKKYASVIPFFR